MFLRAFGKGDNTLILTSNIIIHKGVVPGLPELGNWRAKTDNVITIIYMGLLMTTSK